MSTLIRQLKRWQGRERRYRFAWGFARWATVVISALILCCLIDWWIDRYRDTPYALRVAMLVSQLLLLMWAARYLLFRLNVPKLDELASIAETKHYEFGHRLVTSLQLNRPTARVAGMSRQLIAEVTREAEELSTKHNLPALADPRPRNLALRLLLPVLLVVGGFACFKPELTRVLLARQLLENLDIPRSVHLSNETPELWPSGDEVTLSVRVTGDFRPSAVGTTLVSPEGQPHESYPLVFDSSSDSNSALYIAKLPPSSVPFRFSFRLQDGRSRTDGMVRFEPRPVVKEINAWLRLPAYVDPDGLRRYERFQPQGEVTTLPGCGLRVEAGSTKPLRAATVLLLSRDQSGAEVVSSRIPMSLNDTRTIGEASFELPPRSTGYRIELVDDFHFKNLNPPRRGITWSPDDPPRVNLLTEVLKDPREPGPIDDYEVTGMPLVLGGQVQVGYFARSPLGLDRAYIMYRVNEGDWTPLPLAKTVANLDKLGRFVPELGVFENSGPFGQVEFYPFPSSNLEIEPPGLEAGGRYNFQTAALKKRLPDGREAKLELGDRVEFYVAVYDRNPDPNRVSGKSESRIKAVVTQSMLEDWTRQRDQSRERLRQLEERQRGVFKPTTP